MPVHSVVGEIPSPETLERRLRGLCILERIAGARFPTFAGAVRENRFHFRFEDGAGNELNAVLGSEGNFIQGFDHESPMSPYSAEATCPGVLEGFPSVLIDLLVQLPAEDLFFTPDLGVDVPPTTFCVWWDAAAERWTHGSVRYPEMGSLDDDGASFLIRRLAPTRFQEELGWPAEKVKRVFETGACEPSLAAELNPAFDVGQLEAFSNALTR